MISTTSLFSSIACCVADSQAPAKGTTVSYQIRLPWEPLKSAIELSSFWQYPGSLTTPPCSEGVAWVVFATAVQVPMDFLAEFVAVVGFNSRFTQPVNGRL